MIFRIPTTLLYKEIMWSNTKAKVRRINIKLLNIDKQSNNRYITKDVLNYF